MTTLFSMPGALRPLWPYQERALLALRRSLLSGCSHVIVQSPTGSGKTILAAHIIHGALAKGNHVIFTVPTLSLIDQTVAAFEAEGIHAVGVMQGDHERTDQSQPVQVCSVQTLVRRKKPDAALVIVDEAHLSFKALHDWMGDSAWAKRPFIGLSATPWTRGLGKHYGDLIVVATTKELIDGGYLSPFVVFAPSAPDLSAVRTVAGDFDEAELAEACDTPTLVGDVIQTWRERGQGRPTLVYGVNRQHAEHHSQRFEEAGVSAAYIDCDTDRPARERIFDRFRSGDIRVICNVATLGVGIDLPMVSCIVDARPTRSEMRFVQCIGRGLRKAPGKDKLIVFDHAGNHLRLGLVTDIHHDRLDDGEPRRNTAERGERAAPLPRLCDECKAVLPRHATRCPECGAIREAKSAVIHLDGELVKLGSGRASTVRATIDDKAAFYGEVQWIARERGYSAGWAAYQFRDRFGAWPNDWRVRNAPLAPPSLKTKQWVRSRMIAYAKGRTCG